ncbi:hypothetical protein NCCP691_40780 [Noviherbaspirillum aridicola]|uniref:Cysteine rich repeat protein n=1 Tax=Noviherbaspirillum aridicola TaxID=2849687 RepID=A0ABQ4QBL5_9BURK|nr:hypothetical protein NCCP691_40780 [Noviherbaspirillum aridicola]
MRHLAGIAFFILASVAFAQKNPLPVAPQSIPPHMLQSLQSRHQSCGRLSDECRAVCEAANALSDSASDLGRCAGRHDYSEDCRRRFRGVRQAFTEYESLVSETNGECSR